MVNVYEREDLVYRTRASGVGIFNEQSFRADKPTSRVRMFCLGGSSSYGYPWGTQATFTSVLGEAVAANHTELHVEAINSSGVSYAMHRLNIVADELLTYEPDSLLFTAATTRSSSRRSSRRSNAAAQVKHNWHMCSRTRGSSPAYVLPWQVRKASILPLANNSKQMSGATILAPFSRMRRQRLYPISVRVWSSWSAAPKRPASRLCWRPSPATCGSGVPMRQQR